MSETNERHRDRPEPGWRDTAENVLCYAPGQPPVLDLAARFDEIAAVERLNFRRLP